MRSRITGLEANVLEFLRRLPARILAHGVGVVASLAQVFVAARSGAAVAQLHHAVAVAGYPGVVSGVRLEPSAGASTKRVGRYLEALDLVRDAIAGAQVKCVCAIRITVFQARRKHLARRVAARSARGVRAAARAAAQVAAGDGEDEKDRRERQVAHGSHTNGRSLGAQALADRVGALSSNAPGAGCTPSACESAQPGSTPGWEAWRDHWKSSMSTSESYHSSPVSQMTKRSSMVSPGLTLPAILSQPVPPPTWLLAPQ